MGIVFESYTTNTAQISGNLPFQTRAADVNNLVLARFDLIAKAEGVQHNLASIANQLTPLRAVAFDQAGGFVRGKVPFDANVSGSSLDPSATIFSLTLTPITVRATGVQHNLASVTCHTGLQSLVTDATAFFKPRLPFKAFLNDGPSAATRTAFLVQSPALVSIMSTGITLSLSDSFKGTDIHSADYVHALVDLIRISSTYGQLAAVIQALQDGLSLNDVAQMIWEAGLVDTFIASGVPEGFAQVTVMLADGVELADGASALSTVLAAIADGFYATLTINTGDDIFTAWVMTPETKAMRSYTNFPFNSYATLGQHFIAAGEAGIYRLGGTTDDGVAIRSAIRTGLMSFGSESMKAINKAYIGTTTTGNLLMRVQATTYKGQRIEQTYRMVPSVVDDARAMRIDVGRGFRSVYWIFELANDEDGASFEVHDWHVLPVTLTGKLI